ncbi:MAG: TauD/TfdA family dioxygenase [Tateyamaria sp.]|jgi:alpha-ketoglutarate-dependent taurine dioxygenase|uniref:TauD/TfdA family dioxygenase n=1 Tax=Tateyamaria sp. TaxID=1929288 RepID=UPI0032DE00E8
MDGFGNISAIPELTLERGTDLLRFLKSPPYAVVGSFGGDTGLTRRLLSSLADGGERDADKISFTRICISEKDSADRGMVTRISRTNAAIPPHTDSSYSEAPHNLVAFEMLMADKNGGTSILVEADRLVKHLDNSTIKLLSMPIFPFGTSRFPIINIGPQGVRIRYYRAQVDKGLELGHPLPENARFALDTLDGLLQRPELQRRFKLSTGQTLFFANRRVLHGRTDFDQKSQRLMHRYRLTIPDLELE